jgi:hypothetical protein
MDKQASGCRPPGVSTPQVDMLCGAVGAIFVLVLCLAPRIARMPKPKGNQRNWTTITLNWRTKQVHTLSIEPRLTDKNAKDLNSVDRAVTYECGDAEDGEIQFKFLNENFSIKSEAEDSIAVGPKQEISKYLSAQKKLKFRDRVYGIECRTKNNPPSRDEFIPSSLKIEVFRPAGVTSLVLSFPESGPDAPVQTLEFSGEKKYEVLKSDKKYFKELIVSVDTAKITEFPGRIPISMLKELVSAKAE